MWSRRHFLIANLGLAAAVLSLPRIALGGTGPAIAFKAGAGRADVSFPDDLFPLDGFAGQHDPLAARVLLLDDGTIRIGIAVIDMTSISEGMIASMKSSLAEIAAVQPGNAVICASHTFSAPHVFTDGHAPPGTDVAADSAARRAFESALAKAATEAASSLRPARLGFRLGHSRVNVNRDVETPHGWWLGADEAGFSDHALGVLRIDDVAGKPLAIVMNHAVQSSIMDGSERAAGGRLISADLAGAAARHVETHYGAGTVAMFLVGAAGDQAPRHQAVSRVVGDDGGVGRTDSHEAGFQFVDLLGERLGSDVVRIADQTASEPTPTLESHRENVSATALVFSPKNAPKGPVTSFVYETAGPVEVPVVLMRFGDIAFVGLRPELAAIIGAWIREHSPFAHTIVATMVDGAAKYMPDAQSYDRFTYEARNSPYAAGTAENVAGEIVERLTRMKNHRT